MCKVGDLVVVYPAERYESPLSTLCGGWPDDWTPRSRRVLGGGIALGRVVDLSPDKYLGDAAISKECRVQLITRRGPWPWDTRDQNTALWYLTSALRYATPEEVLLAAVVEAQVAGV